MSWSAKYTKTGSWRYDQLSEDQTSENPKEQARSVNLDSEY